MSRPDDHVRPVLGAYVLGHLEPAEVVGVEAHLEGCSDCREEAAELAAVAAVLPLADPERAGEAPPTPTGALYDEVVSRIREERSARERKRRQAVGLRLGAVAAALALVVGLAVVGGGISEPDGPPPVVVAMSASDPGVEGEAVVHDDGAHSTWVELTTSGLTSGETYAVWLEDADTGERAPLGTFVGVDGDLYISLYATLPRDRAGSVGVSTLDGVTLMEGPIEIV